MICRHRQAERLSDGQLSCHNCGKPYMMIYELIQPKSEIDASTKKPFKQAFQWIACGLALNGALALFLLAIAPNDPVHNQAFWDLIYSAPMLLIILSLMVVPFLLFPKNKKAPSTPPDLTYEGDEHPLAEAFKWRYAVKRNPALEIFPDRPPDFFYPPQQNQTQPAPLLQNLPNRAAEAGQTYLILYQDFDGNVTNRTITIKKIQQEGRVIYIRAYCHLREETRTFRRDRIIGDITDVDTGEVVSAEILMPFKRKRKPR